MNNRLFQGPEAEARVQSAAQKCRAGREHLIETIASHSKTPFWERIERASKLATFKGVPLPQRPKQEKDQSS